MKISVALLVIFCAGEICFFVVFKKKTKQKKKKKSLFFVKCSHSASLCSLCQRCRRLRLGQRARCEKCKKIFFCFLFFFCGKKFFLLILFGVQKLLLRVCRAIWKASFSSKSVGIFFFFFFFLNQTKQNKKKGLFSRTMKDSSSLLANLLS